MAALTDTVPRDHSMRKEGQLFPPARPGPRLCHVGFRPPNTSSIISMNENLPRNIQTKIGLRVRPPEGIITS